MLSSLINCLLLISICCLLTGESAAKDINCEVQYGLSCRIISQNMENQTEINFTVPEDERIGQIMTVSIMVSKMNNIPSELFQSFPNLTNLILRENSLNKWKTEFLQNADKLSYLYITENPIEVFPDKAFSLSPNLKTLAISFTNVKEFQPDVFEGLDELEHLELNNNPIGDKLTTDTFKWLKGSLRRLKLDDIGLKMISKGLFEGFENLDSLLLKDNLFTQIDATLLPPSLQSLEITKKIQVLNAPETLQIIRVRRKPKKEEL